MNVIIILIIITIIVIVIITIIIIVIIIIIIHHQKQHHNHHHHHHHHHHHLYQGTLLGAPGGCRDGGLGPSAWFALTASCIRLACATGETGAAGVALRPRLFGAEGFVGGLGDRRAGPRPGQQRGGGGGGGGKRCLCHSFCSYASFCLWALTLSRMSASIQGTRSDHGHTLRVLTFPAGGGGLFGGRRSSRAATSMENS